MPDSSPPRAQRADARQNRARILEATQQCILEHGLNVQISEIAQAAGVAVGTIYHHFGSKEGLLTMLVVQRFERMAAHIAHLRTTLPPGSAFEQAVRFLAERQFKDKSWKAVMIAAPGMPEVIVRHLEGVLLPQVLEIVQAGQAAGLVRLDVMPEDIIALLAGVSRAEDAAQRERYVQIVLHGLRP